uniref:hypothetical protein n=1 Tax=Candidatus Roseilinea sp. NK_OTU-006 TaxID=2704250 RepID=UPI001F0AA9B7|nr:hypothetical protein [Candidatus Roseilinea sp. NK_OTU-006]
MGATQAHKALLPHSNHGKSDRHDQHVPALARDRVADHLLGAGTEPLERLDVRLVGQQEFVREIELLHDRLHGSRDLLGIGIAALSLTPG